MSRVKGSAVKELRDKTTTARTKEGLARFGELYQRNPEICDLAERLCGCLFVKQAKLPRLEAKRWIAKLATESAALLDLVAQAVENGRSNSLHDFSDAILKVHAPLDGKRSLASWMGSVSTKSNPMTTARIALVLGVSRDQARRYCRELEIKRTPSKGGRPKGS